MKQNITYQGHPITVELLDPCCAPAPDPVEVMSEMACQEFIGQLEWLEKFLLGNQDLSWQVIGHHVSEVFQHDYNDWEVTLSKGQRQVKCYVKINNQNTPSLRWMASQKGW